MFQIPKCASIMSSISFSFTIWQLSSQDSLVILSSDLEVEEYRTASSSKVIYTNISLMRSTELKTNYTGIVKNNEITTKTQFDHR